MLLLLILRTTPQLPKFLALIRPLLVVTWGLLASSCKEEIQPKLHPLPPLPQDPFVEVYLNHNPVLEYPEPYRGITRPGDDLEQLIVDTINGATSTVDVAVQELQLPNIAQALALKHQAGVRVRVILENTYNQPLSELTTQQVARLDERSKARYEEWRHLIDRNQDDSLSPEEIAQGDALIVLKNAGVPKIDDTADGSKGSGLMHHKFAIADGRTVLVTSANFTTSDIYGDFLSATSRGNPNNLLKIKSPELASLFQQEFNLMWGDGPGGKSDSLFGVQKPFRPKQSVNLGATSVGVQFAPTGARVPWDQSVNGAIATTLNRATQSVDLALFVFSKQQLSDTLYARHRAGVRVRALIESSFAYRSYSEGLDMMGVALPNQNCQYHQGNQPWTTPLDTVGVPQLPPGDRLHHKFALLDDRIVITGSHNWSAAANSRNDETLLVIDSPIVAAHFRREFERLYSTAHLGLPTSIQAQIQQQTQQCASPTPVPALPVTARINVNRATQQELEELPGIGPGLAARIIATRQQQPFTSVEDLQRVSGIGPTLSERLRDRVTF
ncbi:phospholipase D-like domain-containing protein [Laspinema olomoucense]|uniref:phospholipase D n=1 Tax=Laspinema olomoucense D3b TaxID=2953688 RepID=A0ABT2N7M9_9CYAN|nr:phospholipase D-like domain-containing protein [Laspinema sp. D3b]MCT7987182.1 phospholipase D-like domain-containing protein [Laspinema sp. D3a]